MKKIISLFARNYDGDRLVRNEIVPGAEWVVAGEGIATRKWDGTSCLIRDNALFRRYDARDGKTPPAGFIPAEDTPDPVTSHWPGWLPVGDEPASRWHREAFAACKAWPSGTYELLGPKVQGNPEHLDKHILLRHGSRVLSSAPRDFDGLRDYFEVNDIEGIVWWRRPSGGDCEKVKIKAKDFGIKRGAKVTA